MLYTQKKSTTAPTAMLCGHFICEIKSDYSIQYVQKIRNLFVKNIKI